MPEIESIVTLVITLVVMLVLFITVPYALQSVALVATIPPTGAWNNTLQPTPVPTAVPTQAESQKSPGGPPSWLWGAVIIFTLLSLCAAAYKFGSRQRPNARQSRGGVDGALDSAARSHSRRPLELSTLGSHSGSSPEQKEKVTPNDQKEQPKSRWESLE